MNIENKEFWLEFWTRSLLDFEKWLCSRLGIKLDAKVYCDGCAKILSAPVEYNFQGGILVLCPGCLENIQNEYGATK